MIVLDTSALVAILRDEPEAESFKRTLFASEAAKVGAATVFEFMMVSTGRLARSEKLEALTQARELLATSELEVVSFDAAHADLAHTAFRRFGKGSGHPAQLNFGDCMTYAVAKSLDAPLLYKGDDFAMTDIRSAA